MRLAETVTFGGTGGRGAAAGLDRAAHLRLSAETQARLAADPASRLLPVWRGKPLIAGEGCDRPGWLEPGHPVLALGAEPPVFLGLAGGVAHFARDISDWQPPRSTRRRWRPSSIRPSSTIRRCPPTTASPSCAA